MKVEPIPAGLRIRVGSVETILVAVGHQAVAALVDGRVVRLQEPRDLVDKVIAPRLSTVDA